MSRRFSLREQVIVQSAATTAMGQIRSAVAAAFQERAIIMENLLTLARALSLLAVFTLVGCIDINVPPDENGEDEDGGTTTSPGETDDEAETETDETDDGEPLPDMPADETGDDGYQPGEMWGPCPVDEGGTIDLCTEEGTACVPTQDGNMCLPIGACPGDIPLGTAGELGWGDACYPRCSGSTDCGPEMICDVSLNGEPMCAWPT
jgi:hypothetical protein